MNIKGLALNTDPFIFVENLNRARNCAVSASCNQVSGAFDRLILFPSQMNDDHLFRDPEYS